MILPAQHAVREEIEARFLLDRDELCEIALDQLVDGFRGRAPAVEVARRLDERVAAWVDPGRKGL